MPGPSILRKTTSTNYLPFLCLYAKPLRLLNTRQFHSFLSSPPSPSPFIYYQLRTLLDLHTTNPPTPFRRRQNITTVLSRPKIGNSTRTTPEHRNNSVTQGENIKSHPPAEMNQRALHSASSKGQMHHISTHILYQAFTVLRSSISATPPVLRTVGIKINEV